AVAPTAAAELVEERDDEARAAHPERMTERDRAAVDVHLLRVEAELADHGEALRSERLVQLDEIDLIERDAGALQQLAHGRDRADAHQAWVDAGDGATDEGTERFDAELTRLLLRRDHERRRAVVDPGGVAGRNRAALAEGGLQRGPLLGCRIGARVPIAP